MKNLNRRRGWRMDYYRRGVKYEYSTRYTKFYVNVPGNTRLTRFNPVYPGMYRYTKVYPRNLPVNRIPAYF